MAAYYNENDPYAAQWLRNLVEAGHIAAGDVDERSIVDVRADDLRGYTQCHFFAGIGGWSLALRLAGWPDERPVWTGSCPCQPFSAAGAGKAADDERHLWPAWFPLIAQRRPPIVFAEQVEAAVGWGWVDAVFSDLEAEGYACGATVLPACGVGAPHIRQRLWFVADAVCGRAGAGAEPSTTHEDASGAGRRRDVEPRDGGKLRELADARRGGRDHEQRDAGAETSAGVRGHQPIHGGDTGAMDDACGDGWRSGRHDHGEHERVIAHANGGMGDASSSGLSQRERDGRVQREAMEPPAGQALVGGSDAGDMEHANGSRSWAGSEAAAADRYGRSAIAAGWACDWLPCTDGKARPVEPGTFPLAHGIPGRVGRLRAYGNAIVPQVAAEFIRAAMTSPVSAHPDSDAIPAPVAQALSARNPRKSQAGT